MLKSLVKLARPTSVRALTGFLSPGRNYCAAKADGKNLELCKESMLDEFILESKLKESSEAKAESKPEAAIEEVPAPEATVKSEKTGNITLIALNRAEVRNCINSQTAELLSAEIEKFENDPESPVAILYGVGGNFCAGYDLKELAENKETISSLLLRSEGAMVR